MRKMLSVIAASLLALGLVEAARAETISFNGTLTIKIQTLAPVSAQGTGVATVDGAHINSLAIPGSVFAINQIGDPTLFVTSPGTPNPIPAAAPIAGVQVTAHNGAGNFSGGTLGGQMAVQGLMKFCLFASCSLPPPANLSVPLTVGGVRGVGLGGAPIIAARLVNVTVQGAPWTVGTASVGTTSIQGFQHGPASLTSSTALASGEARLVTPIFISTNVAASLVLPAFGILDLHFVPEPSALLLLASGIAGLVAFGRTKRV